jgi:radical SAM protein with 4Fe4S-binding SPASM domain
VTEAAQRKAANSRMLDEDVAGGCTVFRGLPEVVALHTTERCNLRCTMCVRSLGQGKLQLERERLAAVCDALFPTAWKTSLSAAAGEPLLADFDLVLDRARAHEVRIDLVTNGTELTAELYSEAAPAFDHVNVSVDCAEPEVYERVRVGARFTRLAENLHAVAEQRRTRPDGVLLSLSAVVMRSTLPYLESVVRLAHSIGADGVILQRLHHSGLAVPHEETAAGALGARLSDVRALAHELGVNVAMAELGLENVLVRPVRDKVPPIGPSPGLCWFVARHIGIQPTGEVYPCCYPTDHRLGDVTVQAPADVWNGPAAQALRAAHLTRRGTLFCSGCEFAPHLRARRPARLVQWLRKLRLRGAHRRYARERIALRSDPGG